MSTPTREDDLSQWLNEEALNFAKILNGEPRLSFQEWKAQRDQRARTVPGGDA